MEEIGLHLTSGRLEAVRHGAEDAPLVLCGHGLSANARAFDAIGSHLAAEGRQAVALDFRGRGLSETTPPGSYGLAAHAADVIDAASALVGPKPFDYIGWSMGALIGILAASAGAGRLRRLVLVDHAGRMDDAAVRVVRAGLDRLDVVVDDAQEHVAAVRAAGGIEDWSEQWDAVYRRELQLKGGRWIARTSRAACEEDLEDMLAREDWAPEWRRLAMPVLLVRSSRTIEGGFIVPADQRDGLAATGRDVTVVEVDATHSDVMTARATLTAACNHLA